MALDLTGISNENEFYTSHYLAAILEDDLEDLFATWAKAEEEGKGKAPADLLLSLSRDYARLRSDLARERDAASRLDLQRPFLASFLAALGYNLAPTLTPTLAHTVKELGDGSAIPVLAEVTKKNGAPDLWVLETVETAEADAGAADPLSQPFLPEQLPPPEPGAEPLRLPSDAGEPLALEDILTDGVFALPEPPRWVIALNHGLVVLADRTKWTQKRYLRFDLAEIYGRRSPGTFRALAALLHRESLVPEGGLSLLDTLDESSHKHAFAVSDDLKYSVREAVELLGNEALYDLRERLREGVYGREMAKPLTEECLRYLYRLLFCFYVEARPELGYAPMKSEEYRTGYSLEALRDLELQDLTTEESKNGFFLNDSVATLFRLVYEGFSHEEKQTVLGADEGTDRHTFRMEPLRSHLFDPERTPLLNRVRFRNHVLQRVLECLSLSRPKKGGKGGAKKRRGRISYAQLGINQLGAVYEGLLSYTGFFAEEDLYEVHRAGETPDELQNAWFVKAADLAKYTDEEKLFDGRLRKYAKGTFIYRLSGRNREKSASYYTPEVLTRCVVKYALKELLKDRTADDILSLTICEPALGSGAFANEAVNQLAEAYLERKQAELKRSIAHDALLLEKQKIKAYLADNNVHGVDLNPTAVELAEISLWLNTIYAGHTIPWFGNQLVAGNSLVGARRQVFTPQPAPKKKGHFVFEGVPDRVKLGEARPEGAVYHFLAPDPGMCDYDDKVIRELAPDEIKAIKEWKREFGQPFSASELKTLQKLSSAIDRLWQKHVEERRKLRADTRNTFPVFGHEDDPAFAAPEPGKRLSTRDKDRLYRQRFLADGVRASSPYRRLKTVMDYWCALWFWSIEKASLLPSREEFLLDLAVLLEGTSQGIALVGGADQTTLFPDDTPKQEALKLVDEFGFVDVDKLAREMPRLAAVKELAERHRFLHWELEFAEVFADRGGFDLIVGNPPWIKVEWNEGGVMGDFEPSFVIQGHSATKLTELRREAIGTLQGLRGAYLEEFAGFAGTQSFLNAEQNYPLLKRTQANLFKCFVPQAWMAMNALGASAFIHQEGVYDDPKGGAFRRALYPRLRYHFHFQNERLLFPEIDHHRPYSVNVTGAPRDEAAFVHMSNLFSPSTIDASLEQEPGPSAGQPWVAGARDRGKRPVPGIKDDEGRWCIEGHPSRAIRVGVEELGLFAQLYDGPGTPPLEARLPALHARELVVVLEKLSAAPRRLADLGDDVYATVMWDETNSQNDGTIRRETRFPADPAELIYQGPHIYVSNPFYKTPRAICDTNLAHDPLDLTILPADYLPRTNYVPACDGRTYLERTPTVGWNDRPRVSSLYRLCHREMLSQTGERTLLCAIVPPGTAHVHAVFGQAFARDTDLVGATAMLSSLPIDFRVKSTGAGHANVTLVGQLPLPRPGDPRERALALRTLLLNCLTAHFGALWAKCWRPEFRHEQWTKEDPRLSQSRYSSLTEEWTWATPLRTDFERRQALIEIDVLAAQILGLTLDELLTIYRIQFPVLQQNERDTWYDRSGRIVYTVNRGLPGVGVDRSLWNEIREMESGTVSRTVVDDTLRGGPRERTVTYVAPFDRCEREADYRMVWAAIEQRKHGEGV
jgi:hypothetical protein